MPVAVCTPTRKMTKDEIYIKVDDLIKKGMIAFCYFNNSEFELTVARAVKELSCANKTNAYNYLYITDRNKHYDRGDFDYFANFSPNTNIPKAVSDIINEVDYILN